MKYLLLLLALAVALTTAAHAAQFEIIKEHSKVGFEVDYMMMTKVEGHFTKYQGFFELNDKEDEISKVRVEVYSDSVDSNDKKRDFHLKGHEFLFAVNHPEITFNATGPAKIGADKKFKITGDLTLRKVTKTVTFEGEFKGKGKDPWGKDSFFFTLKSEINRKDFDITWNQQMDSGGYLVGDIVRLSITVQAQRLADKTPFSTHMIPATKGIIERQDLKSGRIKKLTTPTDPKDQSAPKK